MSTGVRLLMNRIVGGKDENFGCRLNGVCVSYVCFDLCFAYHPSAAQTPCSGNLGSESVGCEEGGRTNSFMMIWAMFINRSALEAIEVNVSTRDARAAIGAHMKYIVPKWQNP